MSADAALSSWNFSCPDWAERLRDGRSLVPDLPIDAKAAGRATAVFNRLRLPDVPGTPPLSEAAGDWFRDIVRALFGSITKDGVRQVREIFALVPKKNSKTTGGAAIGLTALILNERPRAELLVIGPTQEIADLAFQQVAGMIDNDPDGYLQKRFLVQEHKKTIRDRTNRATLKIKTFDMKVVTGSKPVFVLLDEIHVMSVLSYARNVLGQIRGGMLANPEACLVMITTQSDTPPVGVFKDELNYARGVRDGRITEHVHLLPILYEFPEAIQTDPDKPWMEPKNWPMVLPNLGLSISLERLVADFHTAQDKGEDELRRWASQHLNVQIGLALHDQRWRGADFWEAAAMESIGDFDEFLARVDVVTAGIDGGGLDDLLGLCLIGRDRETKQWLSWHRAFAQRDVLELRKDIAQALEDFEADGDLIFCDVGTEDLIKVADILEQVFELGLFPEKYAIGFDPQGVAAMVDELAGRGIEGDMVVAVPQGFRLSRQIWGLERKLKDGTFAHAGSAMMNWCVGNAKAEQRGSAVLVTKQTAGKAKIDPLIATFNAFSLMERNPEAASRMSIYTSQKPMVA